MRVINTKTGKSYSVHFHAYNKVPTYFEAGAKSVPATVDGNKTKLVIHPTRETSNRVNFQLFDAEGKVTNVAVDNPEFWSEVNTAVEAKSKAVWQLTTATGRRKAEATEAPAVAAEAAA